MFKNICDGCTDVLADWGAGGVWVEWGSSCYKVEYDIEEYNGWHLNQNYPYFITLGDLSVRVG